MDIYAIHPRGKPHFCFRHYDLLFAEQSSCEKGQGYCVCETTTHEQHHSCGLNSPDPRIDRGFSVSANLSCPLSVHIPLLTNLLTLPPAVHPERLRTAKTLQRDLRCVLLLSAVVVPRGRRSGLSVLVSHGPIFSRQGGMTCLCLDRPREKAAEKAKQSVEFGVCESMMASTTHHFGGIGGERSIDTWRSYKPTAATRAEDGMLLAGIRHP